MVKLLYIMIGMPSAYNSGIEFCERLSRGGFNVTLACNLDISALSTVDQYNFKWLRLDHDIANIASEYRDSISLLPRWQQRIKMLLKQRNLRQQSLKSLEIENLLASVQPDILVIDIECHKAIIQSRNANIPTILSSRWFSIFRQPNLPPLHSTLVPKDNSFSTIKSRQQWAALWLRKRILRIRQRFSLLRFYPITYRNIAHADLKLLAAHNDLDTSLLFNSNGWLIPHVYNNIPVVSMVPDELDFDGPTTNNVYLGPLIPDHNHAFSISDAVLREVDTFIHSSQKAERSIIYLSLGTYLQVDSQLVETMSSIVSKRSDLALIVGLGGAGLPSSITADHANVLYLDSAPQVDILKIADMAVLHAGIGSLSEALLHAVPSLVFSLRTNDQNGCAARIKHHQLGYVLDIDRIDTNFIEDKINALLSDSKLKDSLNDFSVVLNKYQKPHETLERFLSACPANIAQAIQQNRQLVTNREY